MSIIKRSPSTMQEIRWNFKGSEGDITNRMCAMSDARQLGYRGIWDLNQYDGAAYGLQYKLDDYRWGTHGDIYKLDKRTLTSESTALIAH